MVSETYLDRKEVVPIVKKSRQPTLLILREVVMKKLFKAHLSELKEKIYSLIRTMLPGFVDKHFPTVAKEHLYS